MHERRFLERGINEDITEEAEIECKSWMEMSQENTTEPPGVATFVR